MNIDENLEKLFSSRLEIELEEKREEINKIIHGKEVSIKSTGGIEDVIEGRKNPNYKKNELVKISDNTIDFIYNHKNIIDNLINRIPDNIEKLSVPVGELKDFKILNRFNNIKEFENNLFFAMTKEEVEFLINKKIPVIKYNGLNPFDKKEINKDYIIMNRPYKKALYKNQYFENTAQTRIENYPDSYEFEIGENDCIDIERIYSLIDKTDINEKTEISVGEMFQPKMVIKYGDNKEIESIKYNYTDFEEIKKHLDYFDKNGIKVNNTIIECENHDYEDMKVLENYTDRMNISIKYDNLNTCSYSDFTGMRETLKWFNSIIPDDLSPLETTLYAYDIMKTFKYKENEDKGKSRAIHSILTTDSIVCVGYSVFLSQILKEKGISCENVGVTCKTIEDSDAGHQRNLIKLDDDKYDVHGVFTLDSTWDSQKENINALALYRYFLVPPKDYKQSFQNDSIPPLVEGFLDGDETYTKEEYDAMDYPERSNTKVKSKNVLARASVKKLFGYEEYTDEVKEYMKVEKPSLETFKNALRTVRLAEGYSKNIVDDAVNNTIRLNEENTEKFGMPFFKSKTYDIDQMFTEENKETSGNEQVVTM